MYPLISFFRQIMIHLFTYPVAILQEVKTLFFKVLIFSEKYQLISTGANFDAEMRLCVADNREDVPGTWSSDKVFSLFTSC